MLVVFSGPSGAGKNAVISGLLDKYPAMYGFMPTITTRAKREGERDGFPYYFISTEEFKARIAKGEFLEYEQIHVGYYGTSKKILAEKLKEGKTLLKDIDVKGTMNLKKVLKKTEFKLLTIFITAGNKENLRQRLIGRGEKDIDLRLSRYESELKYADKYDFLVENIDLNEAMESAHEIITRCK